MIRIGKCPDGMSTAEVNAYVNYMAKQHDDVKSGTLDIELAENGDKVENLEWCDRKYNVNYGTGRIRLKEKLIKRYSVINLDTGDIYESPLAACKSTGIHNDSISRVCKGKGKKAGGYRWRYLNG